MPETGFSESRTAAYVLSALRGLGLEVIEGLGGTGLVGLLRGARADRAAPFVGLRAELDALPMAGPADGTVQTTEGPRYHGCGHDGHMATLLTVAAFLAAQPNLPVNEALIFQPVEEPLTGAAAMIADRLLGLVPMSAIYALHNIPGLFVVSCGHPPPVFQPTEHDLDAIAPFVAALIVFHGLFAGLPAGDAGFYALVFQHFSQPVRVVAPVCQEPVGLR
ncbi:amidohydrolase [Paracoccus liaowanqingii]|uniref:Amidohydrolase n=1 Tax=Paracoccus liaowanqingii TaxID=2560053 RepID=A0A4P7HK15_9RHOB|nr:amidohydrolase [Paracoccus liaowanqingii]